MTVPRHIRNSLHNHPMAVDVGETRIEGDRVITPITFDVGPAIEAFKRMADAFTVFANSDVGRTLLRLAREQEARQRRAHHHWRKKAGRPKGGHRR